MGSPPGAIPEWHLCLIEFAMMEALDVVLLQIGGGGDDDAVRPVSASSPSALALHGLFTAVFVEDPQTNL